MTRPKLPINKPFELKPIGTWPATHHVFDEQSASAIEMAWAAERPLLVRGEPGTGKSQLARAAAQCMGRAFISEVVHARTEPQDLQWRFDAIARLGEAQAHGAGHRKADDSDPLDPLDPKHFLSPGPLWWAFAWQSARACHVGSRHKFAQPATPDGWLPEHGCVLLIDEIDKADADLPNSLLETLGNGSFPVPWIDWVIGRDSGSPPPLVIITTNEERELPAALLRRCLVLHLDVPDDLLPWLRDRGRIHCTSEQCADDVLAEAARQLVKDRADARQAGITPPGQAEYLDLLRALSTLCPGDKDGQLQKLQAISHFAYRKFREPRRGQ